ncbi:Ger(x)C family spore germination protein [Paenibacillus turpanensis]|uniref:Ger(x)C family spore germination protein n=1 Tax=Paenibacillus turpanensis TaxID=2689078 RepID=UPI00140804DB|nr:Ger(x)C family spore germination protein [Paenibacillus turpanensis]
MKRLRLLHGLLILLLLSGCTGKREINELALVLAVGIDPGTKPGQVRVTAQVIRPADARGQSGSPSGGTGEPAWTMISEGRSLFEAMRNLARFSSRRVFWAHNKVIIINEEVAKQGVTDIIDFFTRNHELRMRTWVVSTPEKTSELIALQSGLEVVSGDTIDRLFRFSEIVAEAPRSDMRTFASAYLSKSTHPVLARLKTKDRAVSGKKPGEFGTEKQIELSGTSIFKRDKMVGMLTPKESRAMLWFTGNVDSAVYELGCPGEPKAPVSLELKEGDFKVTPQYRNGRPEFQVKLDTQLNMVELGCPTPLSNEEIMDFLEKQVVAEIEDEMDSMIEKAQKKYRVDFLELGKVFENKFPYEWKTLGEDWEEVFPEAKITVEVQASITSPVLLKQPTRPGKDQRQ